MLCLETCLVEPIEFIRPLMLGNGSLNSGHRKCSWDWVFLLKLPVNLDVVTLELYERL